MTVSLIASALCLLLVGMFVGVRAVRVARERHWLGGTIRGLVALLLLALAALAATLTVGLQGYRALTFEELAATVRTEPVAPQRFRATITLPDHRLAMYELAGDAFYLDAHILKWHPWANLLGLHTVYELFNRVPEVACERVFLPDRDEMAEYERTGARLMSLETQTPLREFDVIAFSISF